MKAVGHALRWMPLLRAVGYSQTVTFGNTFIGQGVEGAALRSLIFFYFGFVCWRTDHESQEL
jgi:hypothetical protein